MAYDFKILVQKFRKLSREAPQFMDNVAPRAIGTVSARYFKQAFQREAWDGKKWPEVNRRKNTYVRKKDGKVMKNYAKGAARIRPILTGPTGDLGRSPQFEPGKSNKDRVVVSAKSYGEFHNKGKGNLPKRQFMGVTNELSQLIAEELNKQFHQFFNR